jgi:hypothetical protein
MAEPRTQRAWPWVVALVVGVSIPPAIVTTVVATAKPKEPAHTEYSFTFYPLLVGEPYSVPCLTNIGSIAKTNETIEDLKLSRCYERI